MNTRRLSWSACCFCLMLSGSCLDVHAQEPALHTLSTKQSLPAPVQQTTVLPVDEAFRLDVFLEAGGKVMFKWEMPQGYYLYRNSIKAENTDGGAIALAALPAGTPHEDEFLGASQVYFDRLLVPVPVDELAPRGKHLEFTLGYQGCAENLYCYPPQRRHISLDLP